MTMLLYQRWTTAQSQSTARPAALPGNGSWVQLHSSGTLQWFNLEHLDSVQFYIGSYDVRQHVSQARFMVGRTGGLTIDPAEINLLRNYVQAHRLR